MVEVCTSAVSVGVMAAGQDLSARLRHITATIRLVAAVTANASTVGVSVPLDSRERTVLKVRKVMVE